MKILVTGSAGFIGSHVVLSLLKRGDEVVGLDNINDYYDPILKYARLENAGIDVSLIQDAVFITSLKYPHYRFLKQDIQDKETLEKLFEKEQFDVVCHLAAQVGVRYSLVNPDAYIQGNIIGFINILECCRHYNVKNMCYASSSSVYGLNESASLSSNHNVDHPISLYGATKKSNELMAHTYSHLFGIATTGLRFFTVYGPWGRPDMAPFLFTKAALEKHTIDVFNYGEMYRDFTYIDDIVEGIVRVIDNPAHSDSSWNSRGGAISSSSAPYKIYNIGNHSPVKLMDFIGAIESKLGTIIQKNFLPLQAGDLVCTCADVTDLIEDMGYKPATSIEEGISMFIDWYLEFYNQQRRII